MNGNFKARCISSFSENNFTVGKIYDVKNGKITRNDGYVESAKCENIDDLNKWLISQFEEVKEYTGEFIKIQRKKNKVVAMMFLDGEFQKSANVKLKDADGDFKTAAWLVLSKLFDGEKVENAVNSEPSYRIVKQDKYEIGDKVKLVSERPWTWNGDGEMDKFLGKIVTINELRGTRIFFDGIEGWSISFDSIEGKIVEDAVKATQLDWSAFKSGKFAVHCDTEEKAREFLKECIENRLVWCTCELIDCNDTEWSKNKEKTCYSCDEDGVYYGNIDKSFNKSKVIIIDYTPSKPTVREVSRKANVGEWVKIVNAILGGCGNNYKNGDIMQIIKIDCDDCHFGNGSGQYLFDKEYVVLEGYFPEDKPIYTEVHRPAKVGEWIKVTSYDKAQLIGEIVKVLDIDDYRISFEHKKIWGFSTETKPGHEITRFNLSGIEYVVLENYQPEDKPLETEEAKAVHKPIDSKPFKKAKIGDSIKIIKGDGTHLPEIKIGDVLFVKEVFKTHIVTSKGQMLFDEDHEYIILEEAKLEPEKTPLSEYSQEELIKELFNRQPKSN